jgi:hypothetical protein
MKTLNFVVQVIAIGITALPVLGSAKTSLDTEKAPSSGAAVAKEMMPGKVVPYVPPSDVFVPESSKSVPADNGERGHTNILIRKPDGSSPKPAAVQHGNLKPDATSNPNTNPEQ